MAQGAYVVWTLGPAGEFLDWPDLTIDPPRPADPGQDAAVDIYFGVRGAVPKDQAELVTAILKDLTAIQTLFKPTDSTSSHERRRQFRTYYVRLFRLAQLGLEGGNALPDFASSLLAVLTADLINDEGERVKNLHLRRLGRATMIAAIPFVAGYCLLMPQRKGWPIFEGLKAIGVSANLMAIFMLLWIGCFLGVWLSYGIRTTTISLGDLTLTDSDRLSPEMRLLFAGFLTMLLGIIFVLPLVEVKIATFSITDVANNPMLAFLVGSFCGISEFLLPTAVAKRASDFIATLK